MRKITTRIICIYFLLIKFAFAEPNLTYQINGLNGDLLKNAQARLNEQLQNIEKPLTPAKIQQFYQHSKNEIQKSIEPFGYFYAKVSTQLKNQEEQWQASYIVNPGPQLTITRVDVQILGEGATNYFLQKLVKQFPLKAGQPLLMTHYNEAKQTLFSLASQQGYLNAQLTTHTIFIDRHQRTSIVKLALNTGPRYYFGSSTFTKNPLSDNFLQRFAPYKIGDPYSTTKIVEFQDALSNSDYFEQAAVTPKVEQSQHYKIPIDIALVPRKSKQYLLGVGYGTDTGPRASLGWDWRYLNDKGHKMSAGIQISQIQSSLQAIYSIPGNNPAKERYDITASILHNIFPSSISTTQQFGIAAVNSINNWQRTVSLNYKISRFRFDDQKTDTTSLLLPGVNWRKVKADNTIFTKKGNRLSINLQGASEGLFSDTNFAQLEIDDKFIHSPNNNTRIILHGDIGYTAAHDFNSLPPELRFYAGGSQSLRGYGYQELGPGRYLVMGSTEFQYQIVNKWYAGVFYEAGNALNHFSDRLEQDAGISVTWASPIGPVQISLAKSINRQGRPFKLQVYIGPDLG